MTFELWRVARDALCCSLLTLFACNCDPGPTEAPPLPIPIDCEPGELDCTCIAQTCGAGLTCQNGICSLSEDVVIPTDPKCYSPCRESYVTDDGTLRVCNARGLMAGCLGDNECVDSTCTPPGGFPDGDLDVADGSCELDADCTHYQTCIAGTCYSNCEESADCPGALECFDYVCRKPCNGSGQGDECGPGTVCNTHESATNGHCMPTVPSDTPPNNAPVEVGNFVLEPLQLDLSNVTPDGTFTITNNSLLSRTYTVSKRSGPELVAGEPLHWADIGCTEGCDGQMNAPEQVSSFQVEVPADGAVTVAIQGAPNDEAPTWTGTLQVESTAGSQLVRVTYVSRPEGQWSGRMIYFATFNGVPAKLDAWGAAPTDATLAAETDNAFVQKWRQFRNGDITRDEMTAVIQSTQTASWRSQFMRENCPEAARACYPYDNTQGFSEYTANVEENRIPTPGISMPFAMNLKADDANANALVGRIETSSTLQAVGDPAVRLEFEGDPLACGALRGRTVCPMSSLEADIFVGARMPVDTAVDCGAGGTAGGTDALAPLALPWLVPGFERGVSLDPDGYEVRTQCRDRMLPYGDGTGLPSTTEEQLNLRLAVGNPLPDATPRTRELRLLDGVMIDQEEMMVLVKETFVGLTPSDRFEAYGLLLVTKAPAALMPADFEGSSPATERAGVTFDPSPQCSAALLEDVNQKTKSTDFTATSIQQNDVAERLAVTLLSGDYIPAGGPSVAQPLPNDEVHYLCHLTGLFDQGPDAESQMVDAGPDAGTVEQFTGTPCPYGSDVTFFTLPGAPPGFDISQESCMSSFVGEVRLKEAGFFRKTNQSCSGDAIEISATRVCSEGKVWTQCDANNIASSGSPEIESCEYIWFNGNDRSATDADNDVYDYSVSVPGSCGATLESWIQDQEMGIQTDLVWRCEEDASGNAPDSYCLFSAGANGLPITDLRVGKTFYPKGDPEKPYGTLRDDVSLAFRYKTQFRSRSGQTIGFAPEICIPNSNATPYCYDPSGIEQLQERISCLTSLYLEDGLVTTSDLRLDIRDYLAMNFAVEEIRYRVDPQTGTGVELPFPQIRAGFERLNAELLIMLGDESVTRAFASRFDLAGSNSVSFEGSEFEVGGIDLTGGAGFELYSLYQGAQYYQLALDRFFEMAPAILASLDLPSADQFINQRSAVDYFTRLIRASTQKARAYSEVSRRYLSFNEPVLARRVVERAYTAAYMESILLPRLIKKLVDLNIVSQQAVPQLEKEIELASLGYRSALLEMRDVYESIRDEPTVFGFAPDYVPFPVLGTDDADPTDANAFTKIRASLLNKLEQARVKEFAALDANRAFDVDAASFQAELVAIRNNYEDQLAELCGTFEANGAVYPAIRKYAHLSPVGQRLGDPCGLVGNGALTEAFGQIALAQLEVESAVTAADNIQESIRIEQQRVENECQGEQDSAKYVYSTDNQIDAIEDGISAMQVIRDTAERQQGHASTYAELTKCDPLTTCTGSAIGGATLGILLAIGEAAIVGLDSGIAAQESKIRDLERRKDYWLTLGNCDVALNESNAVTHNLLLDLNYQGIEVQKAMQGLQLEISKMENVRNQARRLQDQQAEAEQLAINIEAARNDPNVRIFKNDAVLTADRTFNRALRAAWSLTRVYEYYTATTYARRGDLFLVRLVTAGDISLERYVAELEDAFAAWEESNGAPDLRLHVVSAKDEIFNVPFIDGQLPCTMEERTRLFRETLRDPRLRNDRGYLAIPFTTTLEDVSPATRNHKVAFVEAEIVGPPDRIGDELGRIYLRQLGTGVVQDLEGEKLFQVFPARSAVINTFFNGRREALNAGLYANPRLRDRPFLNTGWELLINQEDEAVNKDIDLDAIEDVRLYIYYTDFTSL